MDVLYEVNQQHNDMKALWPIPVTTPPKESKWYFTSTGYELFYTIETGIWCKAPGMSFQGIRNDVEFWFSESMPPELAEIVQCVDYYLNERKETGMILTDEQMKTLLTHLTNQEE